jgi:hypothetical protein
MKLKLNKTDNNQLHNEGYIVLDGGDGSHPLLLLTPECLQMFANGFAKGHSIRFGNVQITPCAEHAPECPCCKEEREAAERMEKN